MFVLKGIVENLMKTIVILISLFFAHSVSAAESEKIHEDWVKADEQFINSLRNAYEKHPAGIVPLLNVDKKWLEDLGYGYSLANGSNGKGYVSTSYKIVYKDDKPVAYELNQQMPGDPRLTNRYKAMYAGLFKVKDNKTLKKYYNYEDMTKPLKGCKTQAETTEGVDYYMTPFSGATYGIRGGYANSVIENRRHFLAIKKELTPKLYEHLLCSKNPATRLTAMEHYFDGKEVVKNTPKKILTKIEEILSVHPKTRTISGCIIHVGKSRSLVEELSKQQKIIDSKKEI